MSEEYKYPEFFQRRLLALLIRQPAKVQGLIEAEYFTNPTHQDLAKLALKSRETAKNSRLTKPTLLAMTQAFLGKRTEDLWTVYKREITKIFEMSLRDAPILVNQVIAFAKQRQYEQAVQVCSKAVTNGRYDAFHRAADALKGFGSNRVDDTEIMYVRTLDRSRVLEDRQGIIGTWYFKLLDKAMNGGVGAGELSIVLAGGKIGKSTFLARVAAGAFWQKKKVFIASGELSAAKYCKRLDSMLSGIPYQDMEKRWDDKAGTKAQLNRVFKDTQGGNIWVKAFPSGRAKIQDIEAWINTKTNEGFAPDILIVDYLALFKPNQRYEEKRFNIGEATVDLRGLAVEKNIPVWTAAQTNRAALNKPMIGPTDLAEDYSQFFTTDFLVGICQTEVERGAPEDRAAGKPESCRIVLAASRDTAYGAIISAKIERSKFTIKETGYWKA